MWNIITNSEDSDVLQAIQRTLQKLSPGLRRVRGCEVSLAEAPDERGFVRRMKWRARQQLIQLRSVEPAADAWISVEILQRTSRKKIVQSVCVCAQIVGNDRIGLIRTRSVLKGRASQQKAQVEDTLSRALKRAMRRSKEKPTPWNGGIWTWPNALVVPLEIAPPKPVPTPPPETLPLFPNLQPQTR